MLRFVSLAFYFLAVITPIASLTALARSEGESLLRGCMCGDIHRAIGIGSDLLGDCRYYRPAQGHPWRASAGNRSCRHQCVNGKGGQDGWEHAMANDSDFTFLKDDQDRVVLIHGDERIVLGPLDEVGEAMCLFLAEIDFGECR